MYKHLREASYPRQAFYLFAVLVGATFIVVASTSATAFGLYNTAWDGSSTLRGVGETTGTTTQTLTETTNYPTDPNPGTLSVVLAPGESYSREERERMRQFVHGGGTLLVAADFQPPANELLAAIGASARIDRRLLRDERHYYQSPAMPIASNTSEHEVLTDVDRLTLNYGSAVQLNGSDGEVLVRSSSYSYVDANRNGTVDDDETLQRYPIVTSEQVGDGRVIVVGDPSIFINAMIDQEDNRQFARNLFASHDHILLDISHAGSIPPLAFLQLKLQSSALLTAVIGILSLGTIGLWARRSTVRELLSWGKAEQPDPTLSEETIRTTMQETHPDWDDEQIDRIIQATIAQRSDNKDDE